jgi:Cupin-like domain
LSTACTAPPVSAAPIREFVARDPRAWQEMIASAEPAVLRGLASDWPAVAAGLRSAADCVEYLRRFDNGLPVDAIMTPPEVEGRIFYDREMSGFNFLRNRLTLSAVAEQALRYSRLARAPAVAAQSALVSACLPGFTAENRVGFLDPAIVPRIWLGTAITTPTHLDEWNNIGCVVSGRRRFTLFPPEQVGNLYVGPLDFAPTGAPMSLVRLHEPDLARFPKFRQALASAVTAVLEPGDAIFIPPLWWHNVESLQPFNVLVNYWWSAAPDTDTATDSGFDAMIHAVLNLRRLPAPTRRAWRALLDHFVFDGPEAATGHIPPHRHGLLGRLQGESLARWRAYLIDKLRQRR